MVAAACMLNCFSHVWVFVTPWTVAHQAPLSVGFSCQGYWRGFHAFLQIFPTQGANPCLSCLLALAGGFFTTSAAWEGRQAVQFSSVAQSYFFATPWIAARQASLSIMNSRSLLKLMPIELVMPSNHLILSRPLLLLPSIPPSIRVFSNESTLRMR